MKKEKEERERERDLFQGLSGCSFSWQIRLILRVSILLSSADYAFQIPTSIGDTLEAI